MEADVERPKLWTIWTNGGPSFSFGRVGGTFVLAFALFTVVGLLGLELWRPSHYEPISVLHGEAVVTVSQVVPRPDWDGIAKLTDAFGWLLLYAYGTTKMGSIVEIFKKAPPGGSAPSE